MCTALDFRIKCQTGIGIGIEDFDKCIRIIRLGNRHGRCRLSGIHLGPNGARTHRIDRRARTLQGIHWRNFQIRIGNLGHDLCTGQRRPRQVQVSRNLLVVKASSRIGRQCIRIRLIQQSTDLRSQTGLLTALFSELFQIRKLKGFGRGARKTIRRDRVLGLHLRTKDEKILLILALGQINGLAGSIQSARLG